MQSQRSRIRTLPGQLGTLAASWHDRQPGRTGPKLPNVVQSDQPLPVGVAGLIFEFSGVLYDGTTWWRWMVRMLTGMGLVTHFDVLFRVWQREYLPHVNSGQIPRWTAVKKFLCELGLRSPQVDELLKAGRRKFDELDGQPRALPGVCQALSELSQLGIPMAVISHLALPEAEICRRLAMFQVGKPFQHITSIDRRLVDDPTSAYLRVAEQWNIRPSQIGFVANEYDHLDNARNAGFLTITTKMQVAQLASIQLDGMESLPEVVLPIADVWSGRRDSIKRVA